MVSARGLPAHKTTHPEGLVASWVCVYEDGELVGRIYKNTSSHLEQSRWFWALNGAAGQAHLGATSGSGG
jgi:hypothetical protein